MLSHTDIFLKSLSQNKSNTEKNLIASGLLACKVCGIYHGSEYIDRHGLCDDINCQAIKNIDTNKKTIKYKSGKFIVINK